MDNFDLRKYLAEGLLYEEEKELDLILSGQTIKLRPGNHKAFYSGWPPSKIIFVVESKRYRDLGGFNKDNWKDLLGPKHPFVKIASQIPTEIEAVDDLLEITVDLEDLKGITNVKGTLTKPKPDFWDLWNDYSPEQRIQDYIDNGFMKLIPPRNKKDDLDLAYTTIDSLPDNLKTIEGDLYIEGSKITSLPDNLTIKGNLEAGERNNSLTSLPDNLTVGGYLDINFSKVASLPNNLKVGGKFYLRHTPLSSNLFKNYTKKEVRQIVDVKGDIVFNGDGDRDNIVW